MPAISCPQTPSDLNTSTERTQRRTRHDNHGHHGSIPGAYGVDGSGLGTPSGLRPRMEGSQLLRSVTQLDVG